MRISTLLLVAGTVAITSSQVFGFYKKYVPPEKNKEECRVYYERDGVGVSHQKGQKCRKVEE